MPECRETVTIAFNAEHKVSIQLGISRRQNQQFPDMKASRLIFTLFWRRVSLSFIGRATNQRRSKTD
jgi:hypothetical protein